MDPKKLKDFRRGHREDASYEVSSELAKWLVGKSHLKQKVDERTHERRTIRLDISLTGSGAKS